MQVTKDVSGQALTLAGKLDIKFVEKTRAALLEYLQADSNLVVDLSQITDCDTPGLQLLYSTKQTAAQLGKAFAFVAISEAVRTASADLGLAILEPSLPGGTQDAA
jgi:anti-anti-sigma factor